MTYEQANQQLTGRCKDRRKIDNNTYLERRGDNIVVHFHATDIMIFRPDGSVSMYTGGWRTRTTKTRINNNLSGARIHHEKGLWYLHVYGIEGDHLFKEGITLHRDLTVSGAGDDPKALLKIKRKVSKFVDGYMEALDRGEVPPPGNGDCFYCQGIVDTAEIVNGKLVVTRDNTSADHIRSHMEENYYVPRLMSNAIMRYPVSQAALWYLGSFWDTSADVESRNSARRAGRMCADQLKRALRRYMNERLGMAA